MKLIMMLSLAGFVACGGGDEAPKKNDNAGGSAGAPPAGAPPANAGDAMKEAVEAAGDAAGEAAEAVGEAMEAMGDDMKKALEAAGQ